MISIILKSIEKDKGKNKGEVMFSNFMFIKNAYPSLYELGYLAEHNIFNDADTSLYKLRKLGEELVQVILEFINVQKSDSFFLNLNVLERGNYLDNEILTLLHSIRIRGNSTIHNSNGTSIELAKRSLYEAFQITTYFYVRFVDQDFKIPVYREPNYAKSIDHSLGNQNRTSYVFEKDKLFFDSFMSYIEEVVYEGIIDKKVNGFGSVKEVENMSFHEFHGFFRGL